MLVPAARALIDFETRQFERAYQRMRPLMVHLYAPDERSRTAGADVVASWSAASNASSSSSASSAPESKTGDAKADAKSSSHARKDSSASVSVVPTAFSGGAATARARDPLIAMTGSHEQREILDVRVRSPYFCVFLTNLWLLLQEAFVEICFAARRFVDALEVVRRKLDAHANVPHYRALFAAAAAGLAKQSCVSDSS